VQRFHVDRRLRRGLAAARTEYIGSPALELRLPRCDLIGVGNESVMKDCASKPEMFFKLTSSDQVVATFNSIGTKLVELHLAQ